MRSCFYACLLSLLCCHSLLLAQNIRKEKMAALDFMVGEWVGVSSSYRGDTLASQVPAFERMSYKLDSSIITIDLFSQSLQLHTVIYYDEAEGTYYYNSYYKKGAGRYKAEVKDGKFMVWASSEKRFIFHRTPDGKFQEYGERLEGGEWKRYFEDNFIKME